MTSAERRRELLGLCLLALALFLVLSFVPPGLFGAGGTRIFASGNLMGVVGRAVAGGLGAVLGAGVPALPLVLAVLGAACFGALAWETAFRWSALATGLAVLFPAFLALFTPALVAPERALLSAALAGWVGRTVALPLVALLDVLGAALTLLLLAVIVSVATVGTNPLRLLARGVHGLWRRLRASRQATVDDVAAAAGAPPGQPAEPATEADAGEPFGDLVAAGALAPPELPGEPTPLGLRPSAHRRRPPAARTGRPRRPWRLRATGVRR